MSNGVKQDILNFLNNPTLFSQNISSESQLIWKSGFQEFIKPIFDRPQKHKLRTAQIAVWEGLTNQRIGLVLGPPGTGKTFTLAWMTASYLYARQKFNLPCRVLVTGFTRESMGNLVDQIAKINSEFLPSIPTAYFGNPPGSSLLTSVKMFPLRGNTGINQGWDFLKNENQLVVAITNWGQSKLFKGGASFDCDATTARVFDLILIDEASQMLVSQGLMALSGMSEDSRVIVAGDDRQLAPVRQTTEVRVSDGRLLGGSLYSFLKSAKVPEFALEETFRLNNPLVSFPKEHIYDHKYHSVVPNRRLQLIDGWTSNLAEWERIVLNLEFPVTVLIHDGPAAGTENAFEQHIIKQLTQLLAERMLPEQDCVDLDEVTFWNERLAIVTPHRAQNAALRDGLKGFNLCQSPFVETVDRIQGRERDAIIAGYTVSDPEFASQIASFIFNPNRLNVVTTRARCKLILIVSRRLLEVIPQDEDLFENAFLLREYLYECDFVSVLDIETPDAAKYPIEIRNRSFSS